MQEQLEQLLDRLKQPRIYRAILILALLVVAGYFLTGYIVTAALVVAVGVGAWTMNWFGIKQVGVEFATLATVLIGVVYGPGVGAVMGLALIMLLITAGQYTGSYIIWVIPSYPVAGFLAGTFSGMEIFVLGAALTAGMQTVFAVLTAVTVAGNFSRYFPYAATNVVFNLLLFRYLAPVLLPLMT